MDVGESSDIQEGNGGGIPEFRESSGPTHNLAGAEPVAFFNNLWTEELDTAILTETNRYGDQYTETHRQHLNVHHKSHVHDFCWKRFTLSELLCFLAIIIAIGDVNLPNISSYKSTGWMFLSFTASVH